MAVFACADVFTAHSTYCRSDFGEILRPQELLRLNYDLIALLFKAQTGFKFFRETHANFI